MRATKQKKHGHISGKVIEGEEIKKKIDLFKKKLIGVTKKKKHSWENIFYLSKCFWNVFLFSRN